MRNCGLVTNLSSQVDQHRLSQYIFGKHALVAQGGGQRSIFTAGVLDAFLTAQFDPFEEFYGTSAGALNLCAYLCRQKGLGHSFLIDLTTDDRFFHLFHYIRRKQYLGIEWALDTISSPPYKLDIEMGKRVLGERKAFAAVTHGSTLHDHYLPLLQDDWYKVMVATCAIPRLYPSEVEIGGEGYVDGGVSAAIPVQQAWRNEARCIVVIRTEGADIETELDAQNPSADVQWYRESLNTIQEQWQEKLGQWKLDWNGFFQQQVTKSKQQKMDHQHLESINGGRWLFGADDIYRLSHLVGDKFDSGLADMLMAHYQTYSLTQDFLHHPPDDCFIVQIKPDSPLRSKSLMSDKDDLLHDYQLGLDAGEQFVRTYLSVKSEAIDERGSQNEPPQTEVDEL
ncbi:patatin family protein [uncultured Vibrio sp.]|uniref:patatin-like phospholipase family protein n=1 Tax=uncultured Vibrio sp. TaxID=114054 RepID=UPI000918F2A0|nr:patatin-like phospholipase family protein [uncultured Vibrio sp.]OIQ24753.1 MAG: patatin family protein [Vibrio sp. MedPE-SWchi]